MALFYAPATRYLGPIAVLIALALILGFVGGAAAQHGPGTMRIDGSLDFLRPDGTSAASISIEIAETDGARSRGLMGREVPDFTTGMLFVFDKAQILHFWMRNTPSSLDMIFITDEGEILNIAHRTIPMSDTIYSSAGAARYVVEVRGGFAEHFGIERGGRIEWQRVKR